MKKLSFLVIFYKDMENKVMKHFLQEHKIYDMIKQNTCFKGDGGWYIDLLIINSKFSFMKRNFFETGLSDHHHKIYTFLKTKFEKFEPKKLTYCNFKQLDSDQFKLENPCSLQNNFVYISDKDAPKKTKNFRDNQKTHFNKNLCKQMMTRSCLTTKPTSQKIQVTFIVKFKQQQNLVQT